MHVAFAIVRVLIL